MTIDGRRIVADDRLRTAFGMTTLVGGVPLRIITCSVQGAAVVRRWFAGEPVGPSDGERRLAARLLDAGIAHPSPASDLLERSVDDLPHGAASIAVVIPVKDDAVGLETTLRALARRPQVEGRPPITIVDDGSSPPLTTGATTAEIELLVLPRSGGPGPARNHAAERLAGHRAGVDVLAFVDAGVEVTDAQLRALANHFADDAVAAVAPRVRSRPGPSLRERYERRFSPLDLGPRPGPVGPGRSLTYVPTACLLVRRSAFDAVGGFDDELRYGEDVDLVWRLAADARVIYDPSVEVVHPPRSSWGQWWVQRMSYGSAAGPLAIRHGDRIGPWQTSIWSLGFLAIAAAGHPVAAFATTSIPVGRLRRRLHQLPEPTVEAAVMVFRGHGWAARSLAENTARTWLLPALTMVALGLFRRRVLLLIAAGWARRITRATPGDEPESLGRRLGDAVVGAFDDAAYGLGVWRGSLRARTWEAVLPVIHR